MTPTEVQKIQELVYELKIGDIMTRHVFTVTAETTMREVRDLMRDHRISGLPVLSGADLAGIISIQDLIHALEENALDAPVSQYMSTTLYTMGEREFAVRALSVFAKTNVGRLPVVGDDGRLVGVISRGDITRGVLKALEKAYDEAEIRRYRARHLFEDVVSDRTSLVLRYDVPVRDFTRAGRASSQLKQTLNRLGVEPRIVRRVAIIAYEAEMNIVIHSANGGSLVAEISPDLIVIVAYDRGPGIRDVEQAMQPGFSTAPDWIREMGFGAGMGLANINSCADQLHVDSWPLPGTRLEAIIHLNHPEGKATDETEPNR
jgi:CBS domain-containing protein/anti-sigma regulatory factor (Ser/Thr protein kinase)